MKVTKTFKRDTDITATVDILCNKCGKSCVPPDALKIKGTPVKWIEGQGYIEISEEDSLIERGPEAYGLVETTVVGGYFSDPLDDCTTYTFSICEDCLDELFNSFKIPVEINHY